MSTIPQEEGLKITILGSGSSGNSAVISCGSTNLLLDCGFSGKEIQKRLALSGINENEITGILITHEHGDHVQSAHTLSNRFQVPIYSTEGTFEASIASRKFFDWIEIHSGTAFKLGDIDINPITLPHDACDPIGFRFEAGQRICSFITDCGYASGPILEALKGAHTLVVEANHDLEMLRNGPYPWPLKQRVASRTGHLSNDSLFETFEHIFSTQTTRLVLAHISENNNHPGLLRMQTKKRLSSLGLDDLPLFLADQKTPMPSFLA